MKNFIQDVFTGAIVALAVIVFGIGIGYAINEALSLPQVYTSYTTGECVAIILEDGTRVGCERLSEFPKYETVWVQ